ncbi:MAG: lipopolysaccharide heptosyltransferase II [Candidatus Aminicenantes bacterium]|nr:MAG: lipopolysaccharide heptosyltransferase II [Candidatus Aminicenantes bacterium]
MNIVIRSPNWIGDCIMCLPALRALKDNFPDANIYMAAKQYLCPIYDNIAEINEMIPLPGNIDFKSIFKAARQLKPYGFDYGILFTNSFHSAFLFKLAGIGKLIGYVKDLRGWLLYKKIKFPGNNKHHIYFYLDLVKHFLDLLPQDKKNPSAGFPKPGNFDKVSLPGTGLIITGSEGEKVSAILRGLGVDLSGPLVGMSPSAAYGSAKEWPPERFRELIHRIQQEKSLSNAEILLFGSANEREKISRIADGETSTHNLAGQLKLREAIAAISLCGLFISNDSGLMHIASGFNLPLVALFGPTQPHKTGPLNKNARLLYHPVECAPCLHRDCRLKHKNHACMKAITVDEVLETIRELKPYKTLKNKGNE